MNMRNELAKAAMQAILSNPVIGDSLLHEKPEDWVKDICEAAYEFADQMIKESIK